MERVTINGRGPFYEIPYICGVCKCYLPNNMRQSGGKGWCTMWGVKKNYYNSLPKRCTQMFEGAFRIGGDVVLVEEEKK